MWLPFPLRIAARRHEYTPIETFSIGVHRLRTKYRLCPGRIICKLAGYHGAWSSDAKVSRAKALPVSLVVPRPIRNDHAADCVTNLV